MLHQGIRQTMNREIADQLRAGEEIHLSSVVMIHFLIHLVVVY